MMQSLWIDKIVNPVTQIVNPVTLIFNIKGWGTSSGTVLLRQSLNINALSTRLPRLESLDEPDLSERFASDPVEQSFSLSLTHH